MYDGFIPFNGQDRRQIEYFSGKKPKPNNNAIESKPGYFEDEYEITNWGGQVIRTIPRFWIKNDKFPCMLEVAGYSQGRSSAMLRLVNYSKNDFEGFALYSNLDSYVDMCKYGTFHVVNGVNLLEVDIEFTKKGSNYRIVRSK